MTSTNNNIEQIWQATLKQLQLQMTRATYDTWLKDTFLISLDTEDNQAQAIIGVKNDFAKDWLKNRLCNTVTRTLSRIIDESVTLEFEIKEPEQAPPSPNGDGPPIRDIPRWAWEPDPEPAPFSVHISEFAGKTHYHPMPDYYIEYWEEYLTCRWQTAGRQAFLLRQKLLAMDKRKVTDSKNFTNWTEPIELSYNDLGEMIGVPHSTITGREGHCHRYEEARKFGRPLSSCCGLHHPACEIRKSRSGQSHCYFWRTGVLEALDAEKLIAVDSVGKNRRHKVRLQVWHSLPPLTPFQVEFLSESRQQTHLTWLSKNIKRLGFSLNEWRQETSETFVDKYIDYDLSRIYYGRHQLNPYRQKSTEEIKLKQ